MYIFYQIEDTIFKEEDMKDVMMLLGFSMGLLTGALLYKYSQNAKEMIDQGEKKVMKEVDKMASKTEKAMNKAEKKIKERIQKDMTETKERSQYTVIWVAVNNGYSDEVVEVAHAAGTKGGTVIKSLHHHSKQANQHFGIPLQDEQEIVMIVTPREKKKEVMTRLCKACGLGTTAHGIIISMPVDEVMGIEG